MKLARVGFVGWRGMVGSVLLQRMRAENDFSAIEHPIFLTTSQVGTPGPDIGRPILPLQSATDLPILRACDAIVSCQGGDYSKKIHAELRQAGWSGYWLDAASTLRMTSEATIVLDPVNRAVIDRALAMGKRDFIGGNCTVSLMLMALNGLFSADLIEWMTVATYQAVSGGGARQMRELIAQMGHVHAKTEPLLADSAASILAVDAQVTATLRAAQLPHSAIGYPLAGNLLAWIDQDSGDGMSREEWKGSVETNKILGREQKPIPIASTCVRIGAMRCHSQAFTIQLKQDLPLDAIEQMLANGNEWVTIVPNQRQSTLTQLSPAAVSGTMQIAVGRVHKLPFGRGLLTAFTVGDQLLWGAAEPLRRMLRILQEFCHTP